MRISVNLASRPFVEIRPMLAALRVAMVLLALLALGLGFWLHALTARADAASAQMNALKRQTAGYQQERAQDEAKMHQPQNMGVLGRSQFLNALFARKSFSWTAVMMDLERVLPAGVQVTSIEPVVAKDGEVTIRLRVTGDRTRAIQLVRNLERSQRFLSPRLGGESALTADKARALGQTAGVQQVNANLGEQLTDNVEFEIFSGYNPLPERSARHAEADPDAPPRTTTDRQGRRRSAR